MELQERGDIFEFITGPLGPELKTFGEDSLKSNQIMDFLMGYTPSPKSPEPETDS